MIRLNLVTLHIFFFLCTIFFFEKVDHTNLALSLLISFLILNEYFNDKFYFLTANKIFLIGGYYYLVIFPVFYSIGFIKAETFVSSDLTLACVVSLFSITGYIIGRNIYLSYSPNINYNYRNNIYDFQGFGKRKIDSFVLTIFFIISTILILLSNSIAPFLNLSLLVILFSYTYLTVKNQKLKNLLLLAIFAYSAFITLSISGSRVDLIKIFISSLFLYLFLSKKRIKITYILFFLSIGFIGVIYITVMRTWSLEADLGVDNIFGAFTVIFNRNNGLLGLVLALGDIGIAYDNLIYLIRELNLSGLLMGSTLIRPLLILIPRSLWASKPLDTQTLIVEKRLGEGLSEFGGGTSQSITLSGDFFWNFSYFGAFMGFLFFGFLIMFFDKKTHNCNSLSSLILIGVSIPFFFVVWRGAFSSQLIYTLFSIMPLLGLILIHKIFKEFKISINKN